MSFLQLLMFAVSHTVYSQDTIVTKTGREIAVSIIDTTGGIISYVPLQKIYKIEVEAIKYKNGSIQKYVTIDSMPQLNRLKKGNKVFIEAEDNGVYEHTKYCMETWQYWQIVNNIADCDIILSADVSLKKKAEAHLRIINPTDRSVILDVPTSYVLFGDYGNPKRAAIIKNVGEKLKPLVTKEN